MLSCKQIHTSCPKYFYEIYTYNISNWNKININLSLTADYYKNKEDSLREALKLLNEKI